MDIEAAAEKIFAEFDKDHNGSIDANELKTMLQQMYGLDYVVTDKEVQETMKFMDTNEDGRVSKQEYIDIVKKSFATKNT